MAIKLGDMKRRRAARRKASSAEGASEEERVEEEILEGAYVAAGPKEVMTSDGRPGPIITFQATFRMERLLNAARRITGQSRSALLREMVQRGLDDLDQRSREVRGHGLDEEPARLKF